MNKFLPPLLYSCVISCTAWAVAAPVTISGTITDEVKKPLPGVTVVLAPLASGPAQGEPQLVGESKSGVDGKWTFTFDTDEKPMALAAVAWRDGLTPASTVVNLGSRPEVSAPALTLQNAAPLRIRLVDWNNKPVRGATARYMSRLKVEGNSTRVPGVSGFSASLVPRIHGDQGELNLPYALDGERLTVQAWGEGVQAATIQVAVPQDQGLTVRLAPQAAMSGRVVDETGKPLADYPLIPDMTGQQTRTAEDGTFLLRNRDAGWQNVQGDPLRPLRPTNLKLIRGQTVNAGDLVATEPVTLSGKVTDKANEKPLDGTLEITLANADSENEGEWVMRAPVTKGEYKVTLPSGEFQLSFIYERDYNLLPTEAKVTLKAGVNAVQDLTVDLTAKVNPNERSTKPAVNAGRQPEEAPDYLYGTVLGRDGKTVRAASVAVVQGESAVRDALTNQEGQFALGPLRGDMTPGGGNGLGLATGTAESPAPPIFLRVEADGYAAALEKLDLPVKSPIKITLPDPMALELRFVDDKSHAVPGVQVSTKNMREMWPGTGGTPARANPNSISLPSVVTGGADGTAAVKGFAAPGIAQFTLEKPGFATVTSYVALPRKHPAEIVLQKPAQVRGRIKLGDTPLEIGGLEAKVSTMRFYPLSNLSTLNAAGEFTFDNLPPTSVSWDEFALLSLNTSDGEKEISPGITLRAKSSNGMQHVMLFDKRQPETKGWIAYATPLPYLEAGKVLTQDIVFKPMSLVKAQIIAPNTQTKASDYTVRFQDPMVNSMYYFEPQEFTPDKDGKVDIWIPSEAAISLEIRPKAGIKDGASFNMWIAPSKPHEVVAMELNKQESTRNRGSNGGQVTFRIVGPDGATVPRVRLGYQLSSSPSYRNSTVESGLDGIISIYSETDPEGATLELTSPLLKEPARLTVSRKQGLQRVRLDEIPVEMGNSRRGGREYRPGSGIAKPAPASMGEMAPELKVPQWLRGGPLDWEKLKGKTVVISFSTYGLQNLIPLKQKYGGKLVLVLLLTGYGMDLESIYQQNMDSKYSGVSARMKSDLDTAIYAIGRDPKVRGEWRGYNAVALGTNYGQVLINSEGKIAATGIWGGEFAALVDQFLDP